MAREPLHPPWKLRRRLSFILGLVALASTLLYSLSALLSSPSSAAIHPPPRRSNPPFCSGNGGLLDLSRGRWARDPADRIHRPPIYDASCPFHRNAWNCIRNARDNMEAISSWVWIPEGCGGSPLSRIDPAAFLADMRGRRIGFVGDSLNENFLVAFLCVLRSADPGARKWKRKGAWRGGYFPKFDVTVAYHRAVLLANYTLWSNWIFQNKTI
ncbi:hypothetical protein AXF42_Ash015488 [Apostasia shenzhenica]|uniref:Uncharacterized protein n=1 Tax=Apostasia shenzhenica TaxID=1088818 RepID=A0A2H9ZSD0_9ASPA|nr:hypothetical protein AXF42_Ash015488 [Apostasia shenzhenica]